MLTDQCEEMNLESLFMWASLAGHLSDDRTQSDYVGEVSRGLGREHCVNDMPLTEHWVPDE